MLGALGEALTQQALWSTVLGLPVLAHALGQL